ncbi:MAG: hypothetical protein PHO41_08000 [Eubacteriales bacterium]|nr:hypothetical protein [Eubacteriales bacterium]
MPGKDIGFEDKSVEEGNVHEARYVIPTIYGTLYVYLDGATEFDPVDTGWDDAWDEDGDGKVDINFEYQLKFNAGMSEDNLEKEGNTKLSRETMATLTLTKPAPAGPGGPTTTEPLTLPETPVTPPELPAEPTLPDIPAEPVPLTPPEAPAENPTQDIPAEPVPLAAPAEPAAPAKTIAEIPAEPIPLAAGSSWALVNLICMVLSATGAILTFAAARKAQKDEEMEMTEEAAKAKKQRMLITNISGIVLAVGSIVTFVLTQLPMVNMVYVDKWTGLMAAILAANVIVMAIGLRKEEKEKNPAAKA